MISKMRWVLLLASGLSLTGCGGSKPGDEGPGNGVPDAGGGDVVLIGEPPTLSWLDTHGSLHETFDTFDSARWRRSDGWASGSGFNAGWRADHVGFVDGRMELRLDTESCPEGCSNRPYSSGELGSTRYYGYGRYEARMKPARGPGTLTTFILHTGPQENSRWDEIDIAFLGMNTRRFQVNYITDGQSHSKMIDLPFDAADAFHTYGFEWTREAIHWYVDDKRVHTEKGTRGPLPSLPGRIITNFWPGIGTSTESWLGTFSYPGTPMVSAYEEIRHSPIAPMVLLEDFDAAGTVGIWRVTADPAATLDIWQLEAHMGQGLVLEYAVSGSAPAYARRAFEAPQDWSRVRALNFWFRGKNTGHPFRVELLDNGDTANTSERFEYRFQDDVAGWKWMSVPLDAFTRRTDGQPAGAPDDGLTLTSVRGLAFQPLDGTSSVLLDDLELEYRLQGL